MPRQIKFRIWDKQLEAFVCESEYLGSSNGLFEKDFPIWRQAVNRNFDSCEDFEKFCAENFVIQQFTGLLDKNNKEIYEGDIVEFYSGYPNQNDNSFYKSKAEVKFENGAFWPRPILEHNDDDTWYNYELKDLKVIGNIFETPELLK